MNLAAVRIATWNVNSVRTRLDQIKDFLLNYEPDLLALQETKVDDPFFPHEFFEEMDYQVSFYGQKAYNGVAMISKVPIEDVRYGFTGELNDEEEVFELDKQKRVMSGLLNGVRVVNLYVPNGSEVNSDKYIYKLNWLNYLSKYIKAQQFRDEPLCILGDFNIALEDKDIHNPKKLSGKIMASQKERDLLREALGKDLKDAFRIFEQDSQHWSWWDYRSAGWENNRGWRIDHIYLCNELCNQSKSCVIHKEIRGNNQPSDHAPVSVNINWPPNDDDDDDDELYM